MRRIAARARLVPSSRSDWTGPTGSWWRRSVDGRPNRVTCRIASWFESTQVDGAPTPRCVRSVSSMIARSDSADQGDAMNPKLNAA